MGAAIMKELDYGRQGQMSQGPVDFRGNVRSVRSSKDLYQDMIQGMPKREHMTGLSRSYFPMMRHR
jgi:hypothetical protein